MNNIDHNNTIFITGYAKLPSAITAEKLYQVIAVGVEIDPVTGKIIDCDCTLATVLARNFFCKLVTGYSLKNGIEGLLSEIERRYCGSARKAILTALKIIYEKWLAYMEKQDVTEKI